MFEGKTATAQGGKTTTYIAPRDRIPGFISIISFLSYPPLALLPVFQGEFLPFVPENSVRSIKRWPLLCIFGSARLFAIKEYHYEGWIPLPLITKPAQPRSLKAAA
jgi:hypothetical protein